MLSYENFTKLYGSPRLQHFASRSGINLPPAADAYARLQAFEANNNGFHRPDHGRGIFGPEAGPPPIDAVNGFRRPTVPVDAGNGFRN